MFIFFFFFFWWVAKIELILLLLPPKVMYENKGRLLCTAEGSPQELFERIVTISDAQHRAPRTSSRSRKVDDFDLCVDNELGFAKDRTVSRYGAPKLKSGF